MNLIQGKLARSVFLAAAVAAAVPALTTLAGTSTNTNGTNQNGNNPAVTITLAGQTALSNFFTGASISLLEPGTSITLHNGAVSVDGNGNPIQAPVTYYAPSANTPGASVQLASRNFTQADSLSGGNTFPVGPSYNGGVIPTTQNNSALRIEWQKKGSLDGFYDLVNDQIGYTAATGPISILSFRGPTVGNPIYVNGSAFTTGNTINGFTLNGAGGVVGGAYDTYQTGPGKTYEAATGKNQLGGSNRVQFAVGEYRSENFAFAGTPSPYAAPGTPGYGLGNPALTVIPGLISGAGVKNTRQSFNNATSANESSDKVDPQTGVAYASTTLAGNPSVVTSPWNNAGAGNIDSQQYAATAVTLSANPGTGLKRVNLTDAQWLQAAGRLQNGANFNTVTRVANTGQRNVLAANTGLDPTWAVGENDGGDSSNTVQHNIGSGLRFSGKASGTDAQKAISQSRLGVGALSITEARSTTSNAPVRALDIAFNDATDPLVAGQIDASKFIGLSNANQATNVSNFINGAYKAILISHFNTVKAPNQTAVNNFVDAYHQATLTATGTASDPSSAQISEWWSGGDITVTGSGTPTTIPGATTNGRGGNLIGTGGQIYASATGIKGDPYGPGNPLYNPAVSATGDVQAFLNNITSSISDATNNLNPASPATPADGLVAQSYFLPGLLNFRRQIDGGSYTANPLTPAQQAEQDYITANFPAIFTVNGTSSTNSQTIGTGANYGALGTQSAFNGTIPLTATGPTINSFDGPSKGNYIFGNFNQNGSRDLAAVKSAVAALKALFAADIAAGATSPGSAFTVDGGVVNGTNITYTDINGVTQTGLSKGDLIVLGDTLARGRFDGQDLWSLAEGQSLANSTSANGLTVDATHAFADQVRSTSAVLRKNDALAYLDTNIAKYAGTNTTDSAIRASARVSFTSTTGVPVGATQISFSGGVYSYTYDLRGNNAFNKTDVNHDGLIDVNDALTVDHFHGQDFKNLTQQLTATVVTNGVLNSFNLVDANLTDGKSVVDSSDLAVVNVQLASAGASKWFTGTAVKDGPGKITFARIADSVNSPVSIDSAAKFSIAKGTVEVTGTADPFTDTSTNAKLPITVGGGTSAARLAVNASVSFGTGQVDVEKYGSVVITSGATQESVRTLISSGKFTSTAAAAHQGLGYLAASDYNALNPTDTLTAGSVLTRYTWLGDADLNGSITGVDFAQLDAAFLSGLYTTSGAHWINGDFNNDGKINFQDFAVIDAAFTAFTGGGSLALARQAADAQRFGADFVAAYQAEVAVPEPTTLGLLGFGVLSLLRRRR